MSRLSVAMNNDLKLLALLRDELGLQAHLLKKELQTRWQELEGKWSELRAHLDRAEVAEGKARDEVETAARRLVESLRKGYSGIRDALRS